MKPFFLFAFHAVTLIALPLHAAITVSGDYGPKSAFWENGGDSNEWGFIGDSSYGELEIDDNSVLNTLTTYLGWEDGLKD